MQTVAKSNTQTTTYTVEFLFNDHGTECASTANLPLEAVSQFAIADLVVLGSVDEEAAKSLVEEMVADLEENEKVMSVKINVPSSKATLEITRSGF